jgi:hypothetical protein
MLGENKSRREKVAAATNAIVKISSKLALCFGINATATPTIDPSRIYLMIRTNNSLPSTEKLDAIFYIFY